MIFYVLNNFLKQKHSLKEKVLCIKKTATLLTADGLTSSEVENITGENYYKSLIR